LTELEEEVTEVLQQNGAKQTNLGSLVVIPKKLKQEIVIDLLEQKRRKLKALNSRRKGNV